jgi:hypothetical protein
LSPGGELKAAYCPGRLTQFEEERISAVTELPECFTEIAECGRGVAVWKGNELWVVEASGRVALAVETGRPIRGVWGHSSGFYVLAGTLASLQQRHPASDAMNRNQGQTGSEEVR